MNELTFNLEKKYIDEGCKREIRVKRSSLHKHKVCEGDVDFTTDWNLFNCKVIFTKTVVL